MYGKIIYKEHEDTNIVNDTFTMTSDNDKRFNKTSWYLKNNVKFNLDILPIILIDLKADGRKLLAYILTHLKYNTTVIELDRKDVLKYLGTKDAAIITNGIKMLKEQGIIEQLEGKDVYNVPMNNLVRGNVNSMITEVKDREKEEKFKEEENKVVKSYKELSEARKFKIKLKRNGNIESKNKEASSGS